MSNSLSFPPDREELLHRLIDELLAANQHVNLTAVREPDKAWIKHILDSIQVLQLPAFANAHRVVDVGAGAGFPGLALAIAEPKLKVTFVEATRKKCDFIRAMIEKFALNARVICERAEVVGQDKVRREAFDVATARAVGSFAEVCELCLPLVRPGGHIVLWRGSDAPAEAKMARGAIKQLGGGPPIVTAYRLPEHEIEYHLVSIPKTARTPAWYPRRIGLPKQQPL